MSLTYTWSRDRRGVALPLALFTLVIAAVMITAVFYVGRLEQRMGYNSIAATRAFEAAETGVTAVLLGWDPASYNSMANGATIALPSTSVGGNAVYTAIVRRINTSLFLVQAEGRYVVAGQALTRRQVARLARSDPPSLDPLAAVISRMAIEVAGSAHVDGHDSVPTTWGAVCPGPSSNVPGIKDSVGDVTLTPPCVNPGCVKGSPSPIITDINVSTSGFNSWGNLTYPQMVARATKIISGNVSGIQPTDVSGICQVALANNWGDPLDPSGPCGNYFPIIYAPGDVTLSGGWGQGILLVDGDLTINGPVTFYGAVMVKGSVQLSNGDIVGGLSINGLSGTASVISGSATVTHSRCVLDRVATGAVPPMPLGERNWIQLY